MRLDSGAEPKSARTCKLSFMAKLPRSSNYGVGQAETVNLRCPACGRLGTFAGYQNVHDIVLPGGQRLGTRICPNQQCCEVVFISVDDDGKSLSYPAERLDFEPTNIPTKIVASFEEAITDHANRCFKSAAIMVRRTLEEICADRNATGADLKARIKSLGSTIVIPRELLDAADELRVLGNDAAHLEAKVYDDVGKDEVELAIDLCKEILKAVYQYRSLLDRLRTLQKIATPEI
jgi:Domain of unknown function (DUF4145)